MATLVTPKEVNTLSLKGVPFFNYKTVSPTPAEPVSFYNIASITAPPDPLYSLEFFMHRLPPFRKGLRHRRLLRMATTSPAMFLVPFHSLGPRML